VQLSASLSLQRSDQSAMAPCWGCQLAATRITEIAPPSGAKKIKDRVCETCSTDGVRVPLSRVQCVAFQSKPCTPDPEGVEKTDVWQRKGEQRYFFTNSSGKCKSKECSIIIYPPNEEPFPLAEKEVRDPPAGWCDEAGYLVLVLSGEAEQLVAGAADSRAAKRRRARTEDTSRRVQQKETAGAPAVVPAPWPPCETDDEQRPNETNEQHCARLHALSDRLAAELARAAEKALAAQAAAAQEQARAAEAQMRAMAAQLAAQEAAAEQQALVGRQMQLNAKLCSGVMRSLRGDSGGEAQAAESDEEIPEGVGFRSLSEPEGCGCRVLIEAPAQESAVAEEPEELQEARRLAEEARTHLQQGHLRDAEEGFLRALEMLGIAE